jgi:hypothetical protein
MFVGAITKGKDVEGYITRGLVDTRLIGPRHDELVKEIEHRGFNHNSPLKYKDKIQRGDVNGNKSLKELRSRCKNCRDRR